MPHPYEVKVTDGKMLGRGVVDMKGALACMMIAMAALKRSGEALGGDIIFAGVIDEEDSSLGAKALLKRRTEGRCGNRRRADGNGSMYRA